jgi:hypothetical protein
MAEYHEAFWVVVGTTSPVIALVNAVSVASAFRSAIAAVQAARRLAAQAETDPKELDRLIGAGWKRFEAPYSVAAAGFVMNLVTLAIALVALAQRRDTEVWIDIAIGLTILPFSLLPIQAVISAQREAGAWED